MKKEDRKEILVEYEKTIGVKPSRHILRSFGEYDRYAEADALLQWFVDHDNRIERMSVLDYGCGVGDYGIVFAREGSEVTYCDVNYILDFVAYRYMIEPKMKLPGMIIAEDHKAIQDIDVPDGGYDLVIFGEVLEHLDHPHGLLERIADTGCKYIFTSSYPYRSDDPTDPYWNHGGHTDAARLAQIPCRLLLEGRYEKVACFGGELNLWKKKA